MHEALLSHEQARAFYDRFGARQDRQRFYEDAAVEEMLRHLALGEARFVLEFGCGTGRLAEALMREHLPEHARYLGLDVSATMVALARRRLAPFADRATVRLTDGTPRLDLADGSVDRFLSTYVLDLLSEEDIRSVLAEAHRVLEPGGRLGLVSLTHGTTLASKLVVKGWTLLHRLNPALVGGCRPLTLETYVGEAWEVRHRATVVRFGVPSEVLVAVRR
ncbi:class I SAM-dependent methyltransferase [Rhodocaloribacter sp.]